MKVYHLVYEPSYKSVDIHFWTKCNLQCRACYTRFETLDFGLFDDPITHIAGKSTAEPPAKFLSLREVVDKLKGLSIERAIFIGTEPALDPEMPALAAALHREFRSFNIMLTNGLKLADMSDIDEVIFSIKAISPGLHRAYTGRDNGRILKNFVKLYESGKKMQAETVLVPGLIEAGEIEKVAEFIGRISRDLTLRIDAYFPVPGCPWRAATRQEVEAAAKLAERYVNKVSILTLDMKRTGDKPVRIV
jgi:pyruvate formate lyase activating enzyme